MARRIEGEDGKKSALNMRTTHALRAKIEAAAAASGRSIAQEAEIRLEQSLDPIFETIINLSAGSSKSALIIRSLVSVFDRISFDESGTPNYINRAALSSAFAAILEEHYPPPTGLMADLFQAEDPELKSKVRDRFKTLAEGILKAQRVALCGAQEPTPGLSLLQSAQVLGLVPTEGPEAAKLFEAAAKIALGKKKVSAG